MEKNTRKAVKGKEGGFTLIELLVAMFIFVMIMGAMVAVSVAGFRSYGKSRAIKTVTENINFAMNSMAKDIRMGTIQNVEASCTGTGTSALKSCIMIKRNMIKKDPPDPSDLEQMVCYKIDANANTIEVKTVSAADVSIYATCGSIPTPYQQILDFSGTGMTLAPTSGFYSLPTDTEAAAPGKIRGWAEINLNIENPTMETDSIHVQTIVSSRDYNWKETQ